MAPCRAPTWVGTQAAGASRRPSPANSIENINTALDRIDQWTKKNL